MKKGRTILLVDMDAFFASIEQQCTPSLRGKPVLVGGSPDTRTVVAAASYEARPYGVRSGMSLVEALRLCPEAILVQGNLSKYIDISHRVFRICSEYTDLMELYSIDECFLDVTYTQDRFGGAWEIARGIKRRLRAELGLTCSIGIAPNKMLAKLAADMGKPNGLKEIEQEEVAGLLRDLPVEKLHGVGKKLQDRLLRMGITTAWALGRTPQDRLKREFGVLGEILHAMGNGIDNSSIVPYYDEPDIKSVGHSYTLSRNTRDWDVIRCHLLRLSEMVGRRLREQGCAGRTVSLVLRYADMRSSSRQKSLQEYLDDGSEIYKVAVSIFHEHALDKRAIRLVGVCASNLVKGVRQLKLFDNPRRRALLNAMDAINDKYGEFTIKWASLVDVRVQPKSHGFGKQLKSRI